MEMERWSGGVARSDAIWRTGFRHAFVAVRFRRFLSHAHYGSLSLAKVLSREVKFLGKSLSSSDSKSLWKSHGAVLNTQDFQAFSR